MVALGDLRASVCTVLCIVQRHSNFFVDTFSSIISIYVQIFYMHLMLAGGMCCESMMTSTTLNAVSLALILITGLWIH